MAFTYHHTVRLADTDAAGVVYFAKVLPMCHEAYEESLEAAGINLGSLVDNSPTVIPIVHAEVDFFRPMFWGDKLLIEVFPQQLKESEFEVSYSIFSQAKPEKKVAQALTRHVCIQRETRMRTALSELVNNWIVAYS